MWGSVFLHGAALASLIVWAGAHERIPGGGGRGGMQLDLSTGDGAPNGPLPLEVLGDPNALPEIMPWTKNVAPSELAVVSPPPLADVAPPPGVKDKPTQSPDTESTTTATVAEFQPPQTDANAESHEPTSDFASRSRATVAVQSPERRSTAAADDSEAAFDVPPSAAQAFASGGSPSFIGNLPPRYPEVAVQNRWEGDVTLLMHIDSKGRVTQVEVLHGSGHTVLDDEAAAAIRRWIGRPAQRDGMPVESTALLPVHFRLK